MRIGSWVIAAVFLGAFSTQFLLQDRGYVLINFAGYVIEMSVPVMLALLVVFYASIRTGAALWHAPRRIGGALAKNRVKRSGAKLTRGLINIAEGDWSKGERLFMAGLKDTDAPLINYLMAARAAQLQGSKERRDDWLKLAYEELPNAETAVLLTQAELQLEHAEFEQALATLNRIEESNPEHPVAIALLAKTYRAIQDWGRLAALLPRLGNAKIESGELEALTMEALSASSLQMNLSYQELEQFWSRLPRQLRDSPRLIALRGTVLSELGYGDQAAREIGAALNKSWQEDLVIAFGRVETQDPAKHLKRAEDWLKSHAEDGALLLTAARLCMAVELWGKARSYLESSLAMVPCTDAYGLYGSLLQQFGEKESSALAFRSGLALVTGAIDEASALTVPPKVATSRKESVEGLLARGDETA